MPDAAEVQQVVTALVRRLDDVPPAQRSLLPGRRRLEARCPDMDLAWHATWDGRRLGELQEGPSPRRPDVRIEVGGADLLALHRGELTVGRAWSEQRVRVRASVTDMLRLRAALA